MGERPFATILAVVGTVFGAESLMLAYGTVITWWVGEGII